MNKLWVSLLILLFSSTSTACFGVQIERIRKIAQLSDKSPVATIHVPNCSKLLEQIRSHRVFEDPDFLDDMQLLYSHSPDFEESWGRINQFLDEIQEAHAFIWKEGDGAPEARSKAGEPDENGRRPLIKLPPKEAEPINFVLLLKLNEQTDSPKRELGFLNGLMVGETGSAETKAAKDELPSSVHTAISGDWVVIGSSQDRVDSINEMLADGYKPKRSLASDRRFDSALVEFEKNPSASAFVFARPSRFQSLFSNSNGDEKILRLEKLNELSSAGGFLQFDAQSSNILLNTFVAHTVPTSGIARYWETADRLPVEFPEFCFKIRGVAANAWDNELWENASRTNYDSVHGEGKFDEAMQKKHKASISQPSDRFKRSSVSYFVKYESELGLRRAVSISKVEDYDAMKRHFDSIVEKSKKRKDKSTLLLNELPESDPDALVFGLPLEVRKERWKDILSEMKQSAKSREFWKRIYRRALEKTGKTVEELGDDLVENDSWVLTKDWLFSGQGSDIIEIIDSMNGIGDSENEIEKLANRIKWLAEISGQGMPTRINSGEKYRSRIAIFFGDILKSKYRGKDAQLIRDVFAGKTLESLKAEEEFKGDVYDIGCYLVCKAIYENCEDVVIARTEKENNGKLFTNIGVFFSNE